MTKARIPLTPDALRTWMLDYITSVLDLPAGEISTAAQFDIYGLDSVEAVVMAGVMEEEFGVQIDPVELFDHPSIDAFTNAFATPAAGEKALA